MTSGGARAARPAAAWKWLVLLALALAAVAVGERLLHREPTSAESPPLSPESLRPGYGPRSYEEAVAAANGKVEHWRARTSQDPGDWLLLEGLAEALAARFRLTGDYADLAEADRLLERGVALAPAPSGPVLTRAAVSLSIHRLDAAEAALKRLDRWVVPPSPQEAEAALSMRCEVALQRGDLPKARALCIQGKGSSIRLRLANIAAKSGRFDEAVAIVEEVLRQPRHSPDTLATLALIRASIALESGDWTASGRWARAADRWFPGYWLAQAYVAQQYALEGNTAEAAGRLRRLAERSGNPEVIDAYLQLARLRGNEAASWVERARRGWDQRAKLLPEAAAAHYTAHLLAWGDPARALELAAREYRSRPTSGSAVAYAGALAREGRVEPALAVLDDTERRGWRSAQIKLQQSSLLRTLGRTSEADRAWKAAKALNPRIDDPAQRFVLFYQH